MKVQSLLQLLPLLASTATCLNIMSMVDGVQLNVNEYVEIQNFMQTTLPVVDSHAEINQVFQVDIVSIPHPIDAFVQTTINMNLLFDVLIFNKFASDGETENPDFTCY